MLATRFQGALRTGANRSRRTLAIAALTSVLIAVIAGRPAAAITIVGHYLDDDTQANGGENPNWDPGGLILQAHFAAAKKIWENLLYHPSMFFEFDYEWDDDIPGLGQGGAGTIEINPNQSWFVDPTPLDHSEFSFVNPIPLSPFFQGQTLYRDLPASQQSAWFPGTPPPAVLEVGYRGNANAVPNSPAQGLNDLLSTIVHEIGHELGIVGEEPGEYNIYPAHVGGLSDVLVKEDDDSGHLAGDGTAPWLMCQTCGVASVRRLPSATDVLVIAEDQGIPDAFLARVDRISSGSWNTTLGWIGGRVPNMLQDATFSPDVFVRHGGTVSLGSDTKVKSLLIGPQSAVETNNHELTVGGGLTTVYGELIAEANGHVELDQLDLDDGATFTVSGGSAKVWEGLNVNLSPVFSPSSIRGHGYVEVAAALVNNGVIRAEGGTLTFGAGGLSPTPLDIDGNTAVQYVRVDASVGDLFFSAGVSDDVDAIMAVGQGHTITMAYDGAWTLGPDGALWFATDPPNTVPATLDGSEGTLTIAHGTITADGFGVISTLLRFKPDAEVFVNGTDSRLRLEKQTNYEGGSYTGDGVLQQQGTALIDDSTTIATRVYDWDGDEADPSNTGIKQDVTFTIDSPNIDLGADVYDGTISNQGGILEVNTKKVDKATGLLLTSPWTLGAQALLLLKNAAKPPFPGAEVRGAPMRVAGQIVARGGHNRIRSDVTFYNTADVQVPSDTGPQGGDELYLDGNTEYGGGSYTGDGTIHQYGDANFVADTHVFVDTYDWDGDENAPSTTSVGAGAKVWIRSDRIDLSDGYDGLIQIHQGTLIVNTGDFEFPNLIFMPWRLDPSGEIHMFDFAVLSGSGNDNFPEYPGSPMFVAGAIHASGFGNVIYSTATLEPTASVQLAPDARLTFAANTTYQGGTYSGAGVLLQQGDAVVQQPTTVDVHTFDLDGTSAGGTTWTLDSDLTLNVHRVNYGVDNVFDGTINVDSDATLSVHLADGDPWELAGLIDVVGATPTKFQVAGTPLRLRDSGVVHVQGGSKAVFSADVSGTGKFTGDGTVDFQGSYAPGNSPAVVAFEGNAAFGPDAMLLLEISGKFNGGGTTAYDELFVQHDLLLGGGLKLIFTDQFAPQAGDTIDLMHVGGSPQGGFDEINIVNLLPGFQYTAGFDGPVFRLTAQNNAVFVPEPSTFVLGAIGLLGLLAYAPWRRRRGG